MKVKELIVLLQQLENQEWKIEYMDGEYGNMEIELVQVDSVENETYQIW